MYSDVLQLSVCVSLSGLPGMSERERQVMKKLKEVVDKQRDEIRAKDRELTLKNEDIEAVSGDFNAKTQAHKHIPKWIKHCMNLKEYCSIW